MCVPLESELTRRCKATVTPDRTIAWSYDWLWFGQRATDRQCLLRSPEAATYCDRSFLLVVGHRTIGRTRGRAINTDWRRSMTRSITSQGIVRLVVAINDRSCDQSWPPTIDHTINRRILREQSICGATGRKVAWPVARLIVRPHTILNSRFSNFQHDHRPCFDWFAPCDHQRPLRPVVRPMRPVVRSFFDLFTIATCFDRR